MTSISQTPDGEMTQFKQNLGTAGLTLEDLRKVNKRPDLADLMVAALRVEFAQPERYYPACDYNRYDQYLHSLTDQLELLKDLNKRMPRDLRIPKGWFDLNPTSVHVQTVEDLESFHVEFDTLEKTWAFAQKLVELTQPAIYDSGFDRDANSMRRNIYAARWYGKPGLYDVRINLVDHWDPDKGRSVIQVRDRARGISQELAATEAIEAYGLQDPRLYQSQDGENLPYFDCAALEQGDGFRPAPYSIWDGIYREVYFGSFSAGYVDRNYAAPSLFA